MPRLTAHEYLRIHAQLAQFWDYDPAIFSYLSPAEQLILHDFFKPETGMSKMQLLEYRDAVTAARPSLPQQAGRVLAKLYVKSAMLAVERVRGKQAVVTTKKQFTRQSDRVLSVRPLVRPKPDIALLAQAFRNLAIDMAKRDLKAKDQNDRSRP